MASTQVQNNPAQDLAALPAASQDVAVRADGSVVTRAAAALPARPLTDGSSGFRPRRRSFFVRFGRLLSFLAIVVLPTLGAGIYYSSYATPQYVSEFRFTVRSSNNLRNDSSAIFQGMAAASQIGLDSYVVVQYIKSRELVDVLRQEFDFKKLFSRPEIDVFSRLDPNMRSESIQQYWDNLVEPFFDLTTGSVSVRVRAFSPQDAQALSKSILTRSEKLVNDLSSRAREDAVKNARDEVVRAEGRLRQALANIRAFRDAQSRINPEKEADNRMLALGRMRDELAKTNAELSMRKAYMADNSPILKVTVNRIRALTEQIAIAERQLTQGQDKTLEHSSNPAVLSADIGAFDVLESERRFTEEYYKAALISLERARAEADKQLSYLALFVQPTLPEDSTYPKVWQSIAIAFVAGFGLWMFGLITLRSVREHG